MSVNVRRVRFYEWATGFFGAALLGVMFANWYRAQPAGRAFDAWQSFGAIDVFLAITGGLAVAVVVTAVFHRTPAVPLAIVTIVSLLAGVATLLVAIRAASVPHLATSGHVTSISREEGLWLGLVCCVGMVLSAWRSMGDEYFPQAVRPRPQVEKLDLPSISGGAPS